MHVEVSNRQVQWFLALLALGTLSHELVWWELYARTEGATLASYLDAYRQLLPTVDLPGGLVAMAHAALILTALLTIFTSYRVVLSALQWPLVVLNYFLLGTKPPNHYFFLIVAYGICFSYAIAYAMAGASRAPTHALQNTRGFLRVNILLLLVTTYLFAGVAKLNVDFLAPGHTTAAGFVWRTVSPLNYILRNTGVIEPGTSSALWYTYGVVGIASTLVAEFGIPMCLLVPRLRTIGVCMGLIFHLLILYYSAIDFSMVALSGYVLVLSASQFEDVMCSIGSLPGRWLLLTTVACSSYFALIMVWAGVENKGSVLLMVYRAVCIVAVTYVTGRMILYAYGERRAYADRKASSVTT